MTTYARRKRFPCRDGSIPSHDSRSRRYYIAKTGRYVPYYRSFLIFKTPNQTSVLFIIVFKY